MLNPRDLDVVAALQLAPRAPLSGLGEVLGMSSHAVGRRIAQLRAQGSVRIIGSPDWNLVLRGRPHIVWITCTAGSARSVSKRLAEIPDVQTVILTSGSADIYCTIYPLIGSVEVADLLTDTIPSIPGVVATRSALTLRLVDDSRSWRIHHLDDTQEDALRRITTINQMTSVDTAEELSDVELRIAHLLTVDGRLSAAEVARQLSLNRSTAYRLTQSLLDRQVIRPRVQVEPELLGYPLTALISLAVLPGQIPKALEKLSAQRSARFVAMTCGAHTLIYHGVFPDENDLSRFLLDDVGALSDITGVDVATALRVVKRQWSHPEDIRLDGRRQDPRAADGS